jgi:hypothetical protein
MSETFRNFSVPGEFYKQRYGMPATFTFCCFNSDFITNYNCMMVVIFVSLLVGRSRSGSSQDRPVFIFEIDKTYHLYFKILSTINMFGLNMNYN